MNHGEQSAGIRAGTAFSDCHSMNPNADTFALDLHVSFRTL
ncbi:hypothetical protein [Rubritalea marina]|nr:hypothetical protein [Rubritalea marina]